MNGDVCLVGVGRPELVGDDTLEVAHVSFLDVPEVEVGGEVVDPPPVTQVPHLLGAVHSFSQHLLKRSHQLVPTLPNTLNMVFLCYLLNLFQGLLWFHQYSGASILRMTVLKMTVSRLRKFVANDSINICY